MLSETHFLGFDLVGDASRRGGGTEVVVTVPPCTPRRLLVSTYWVPHRGGAAFSKAGVLEIRAPGPPRTVTPLLGVLLTHPTRSS